MTIDYDFHNPDNLTPTQVGEGYRLLLKSEIKDRISTNEIQSWLVGHNKWDVDSVYSGNANTLTYRVPLATWPLPEANYACPPVKHPEAQELQERFAEPAWIPWHGGECPLKDDEAVEWELRFRSGRVKIVKDHPSSFLWTQGDWSADIIAYRVLKWKKSPVKEPAPTDNDTWNSILATNAQLNTKVAKLEEHLATVKRERDYATEHLVILAKTFKLDGMTWSYVVSEVCSRFERLTKDRDYWKEASKEQEKCLMEWPKRYHELEAKLTTAEARLKQLEWVPYSERKPTRQDADSEGSVPICSSKDNLLDWQPWDASPRTYITHWRPFAPPAPIDTDRVAFEKWWKSHRHTYTTTGKEAVYEIWKAARAKEVKP